MYESQANHLVNHFCIFEILSNNTKQFHKYFDICFIENDDNSLNVQSEHFIQVFNPTNPLAYRNFSDESDRLAFGLIERTF